MPSGITGSLALAVALLAGCLKEKTVYCADGRACPARTMCEDTLQLCIVPEQIGPCDGLKPGDPCMFGADGFGECVGRVCVAPLCGDGIRTGTEECDQDDLAGVDDCTDIEFYQPGPVACGTDCRFDVRDCRERCGDEMVNGPEICEPGISIPPESCIDLGYEFGALGCSAFCTPRFTSCKRIGWHRISNSGVDWKTAWKSPSGTMFGVATGMTLQIANGIVTWAALPASELHLRQLWGVWGTSDTDVYAVGSFGAWWHRDATGWTLIRSEGSVNDLYTYDLRAVWGTSPTNVHAVGFNGRVVHYDGTTWTTQTLPVTNFAYLVAIWGSSASDIYAAGGNNALFHFNGTSWSPVTTGLPSDLYEGIWGTGANDVYVVGRNAVIHFDGTQWRVALSPAAEQCFAVGGSGPSDVYVACSGDENSIYRFEGVSWSRMRIDPLVNSVVAGPNTMFVFGTDVYRFAQAAWSWQAPSYGASGNFYDFAVDQPGNELAIDFNELLRYDHAHWTPMTVPPLVGGHFQSLWREANRIVIAESLGQVHHFDGQVWTLKSSTLMSIAEMWGLAANNLWAVGADGIAHFDGASWTKVNMTDTVAIDGTAADDVFALPRAGGVLHFDGNAWTPMAVPTSVPLSDVYAAARDDVFAVGPVGLIVHYDGTAWTTMPFGVSADLEHISGTSGSDVFATGAAATVAYYDGTAWSPVKVEGPCQSFLNVAARADNVFFGCIIPVSLLRSPTW